MQNVKTRRRGSLVATVRTRAAVSTLRPSSEFADYDTVPADCARREGLDTTACSQTSGRFDERARVQLGWEEIR